MTEQVRGLVLAAGLGMRLRPLSDHVPKPLLPVAGVTLLDRAITALDRAGVARIAVNAHHMADRIAAHIDRRPDTARFALSIEPEILGTAGAMDRLRPFLAAAPTFLVHNGDVLSDLDCAALLAAHRDRRAKDQERTLATLALADWPEVNSVLLDSGGRVRDIAGRLDASARPGAGVRRLTYTGIACYDRAVLELVPPGPGSLIDVLVHLLREQPDAVAGFVHQGHWEDIGTLTRFLDAHRRMLGPGFVSAASAPPPPPCHLDECVVLEDLDPPPRMRLRRAVLGRGWAVSEHASGTPELSLAAAAGFDPGGPAVLRWITGHGSDRGFVRLAQGGRRAMLMLAPAGDDETARYVAVASFLDGRGLGAPAIYAHDPGTGAVLMEDLGEDTLCALVWREPARARDLYGSVLDRLAELQTLAAGDRHLCPEAWDRVFDEAHLRWETGYFREHFLIGHAHLRAGDLVDLDREFERLASACLRQPYTLTHRDFQSRNILFKGDAVRMVDLQGMRWGPMAYDAVSLLLDPYVDLPWALRLELLDTFPARLAARGGSELPAQDWLAMAVTAGLQRLMQALGAFGYLGRVKKRQAFLEHIPAALAALRRLLKLAAEQAHGPFGPPDLTSLSGVVASLAGDERTGRP